MEITSSAAVGAASSRYSGSTSVIGGNGNFAQFLALAKSSTAQDTTASASGSPVARVNLSVGQTQGAGPQTTASAASGTAAVANSNTTASASSSDGATKSTWNWTNVAPGVDTTTGPDGTKWTRIDCNEALTADDKRVLGWSPNGNDEITGYLAGMVADDRYEGRLKGPITADYLMGNNAKGYGGLINSFMPDPTIPGQAKQLQDKFTEMLAQL